MLITEPTVEEKNTEKKLIAIIVTVALHVFLGIIFILVTVVPALRDEPEIVAKIVSTERGDDMKMEKRTVMKQIKQASNTSAASPIAKMVRANSVAKMVAPKTAKVTEGPIGLGQGEFGAGFGASSAGMGSGVSFFGSRSSGRRFLFVLDHSASMNIEQEELRNRELKKALFNLPKGVQYQVMLFGGGGLFAEPGWDGKHINGEFIVTDPGRRKYLFKPFRGVEDWEFVGEDSELPKAKWLPVSKSNIDRTLSVLDDIEKFLGTDWAIALKIGHLMRPPPDVIFFMSDGSGGNAPRPILEINRRYGSPIINTFAMQTTAGAKSFFEIAKGTGGEFVIVNRDGKPVKVNDPNEVGF